VRQFLSAIKEAHPEITTDEPGVHLGRRTIPRVVRHRSSFGEMQSGARS
jgi:hypothetical protein